MYDYKNSAQRLKSPPMIIKNLVTKGLHFCEGQYTESVTSNKGTKSWTWHPS